jgi:hypothetical protein
MSEKEYRDSSTPLCAEEAGEVFSEDLPLTGKPHVHSSKKLAKERVSAEQSYAYREQISAMAAQNADYLAALAGAFTEKVPSAAEAVQNLLAVYSASATKRAADFNQNNQNKKGGFTHE